MAPPFAHWEKKEKKEVTFFSDTLKWNRVAVALVLMAIASVFAVAQANNGDYGVLVFFIVLIVFSIPTVLGSMLHSFAIGRVRSQGSAVVMLLSIVLAVLPGVLLVVVSAAGQGDIPDGLAEIAPYLFACFAYGIFAGADQISERASVI